MKEIPQHLLRRSIDSNDFAAKLDADERCTILALYMRGVKAEVLALAYGLNRRTINHLTNNASRHYAATRKVRKQMGDEAFIEKYVTEDALKQILSVKIPHKEAADKGARRKAGIHVVKPEQCAYSHRLEIVYHADREPPGWYYRDMDSKSDPDGWFHNGEDSLRTSQNCLALAEVNLTDD